MANPYLKNGLPRTLAQLEPAEMETLPPVEAENFSPAEAPQEMPSDVTDEVAANGVPQALVDQAKTDQQRLLELQIAERQKKALEDQQRGIAENEAALKAFEEEGPGINLRPLAALTDAWYGGNMAQHFRQPMSAEERQQKLFDLKNKLQAQKQGLSQAELSLLKTQLAPYQQASKLGASDANRDLRLDQNIDKKFTDTTKQLDEVGGAFKSLLQNLTSKNTDKVMSSLSNFARFVGGEKGALSEGDVGRSMVQDFQTKVDRFQRLFGKSKVMSSEAVDAMTDMTRQAREISLLGFRRKLNRAKDTLTKLPSYKNRTDVINDLYNQYDSSLGEAFAIPENVARAAKQSHKKLPSALNPQKKQMAPNWSQEKENRLQELRAKKAAQGG